MACVSTANRGTGEGRDHGALQGVLLLYLVHLFFLDLLMRRGITPGALNPVWSAPAETVVLVACGFVTWLVLRKVPLVKRYLI